MTDKDYNRPYPQEDQYEKECLRLEMVTTCVGFDDVLEESLRFNHRQVDNLIVVTSHDDKRTHSVCRKYGTTCVQTDLFKKNGRKFNKGAAINEGFSYFQYHGWRMHVDVDCILPSDFRRVLFNHTHLEQNCIYGADRIDVIGRHELHSLMHDGVQHQHRCLVNPLHNRPMGARFVSSLGSYSPLGFFQLFHARCQKGYPYSLGDAAHDDILFANQWPASHRRLLPTVICYHLCPEEPKWGMNWEGRKSKRLS